MKSVSNNYLRGAGSIVSLLPSRSFKSLVPQQTSAERMAARFQRIGASLQRACTEYAQDDQSARSQENV